MMNIGKTYILAFIYLEETLLPFSQIVHLIVKNALWLHQIISQMALLDQKRLTISIR